MDKASCREMADLKRQIEKLKVEIGDLVMEKQLYKSRLATIEHDLLQRRDLFEHDEDFLKSILRLTRTLI